METSPQFAVVLAAAGSSTRFGGNIRKPLVKLDGREIFLRSIELFSQRDDVAQVILAAPEDEYDYYRERYGANLGFLGVKLVAGGADRCETVQKALAVVRDDLAFVAVHDAVRPLVSYDSIDRVFSEVQTCGAAILATPLQATLKRVSPAGQVEETLERDRVWLAQTPQVFRRELLTSAYAAIADKPDLRRSLTDDASVVEHAGHAVKVVKGNAGNLKITTQEDLPLAEAILKTLPKRKKKNPLGAYDEAQW